MILRSQLRMNKNIVFPFISCIMIMFTLLVLLHKSADELNTVKKELNHCKEQYESTFTQLQSAIDLKLRLEKSVENEKAGGKQELDKMQTLLDQEREDRRKDNKDASMKYDSLNEKFSSLQTENTDLKEEMDKLNKKISGLQVELNNVNSKLKEVNAENEHKNQIIQDLKEQLKTAANVSILLKKSTLSADAGPIPNEQLKVAPVQNSIKDYSSTPKINPAAVNHIDELPKQVLPPPNEEQENAIQKEMHDSLNMGVAEQIRPPHENVGKPPLIQSDNDKKKEKFANPNDINGDPFLQNGDKEPGMFLPKPPNFNQAIKPASSASNNAAENPEIVQPPDPKLAANEKKGVIPIPKMKDDLNANGEYDNNIPEDEGEVEYAENVNKNKETNQHE